MLDNVGCIVLSVLCPIVFFASGTISILVIYLLSFITRISYPDFTAVRWRAVASEAVFPLGFLLFILLCRRFREERETVVFMIATFGLRVK